ncbi:nuclear factor 7, brain-like [Hypanus sabinus]|uniref:nuclear factor 7, brain-like n=1 Tax=Hypanus sabinus TaxID=79690 RepID=UPI0028C45CC4|nr:nuclear factor 7, brain-like [Hypanus sabinus]
MASKGPAESLSEELICSVCLDFFTDPVSLECGHNFCRSCITRCWEREQRNSCPECREEFADRTLRVNRALANLAESGIANTRKSADAGNSNNTHKTLVELWCSPPHQLLYVSARNVGSASHYRCCLACCKSILNQEVLGVNMASKGPVESLSEEVICPICLDFFTDPVTLECGHNFCHSCITKYWEREKRNSCPECREVFADRTLRVNRTLGNLTQEVRNLNLNPKGKESIRHCEEHEEELKLFCETDKTLICVICAAAQEHREHRFVLIEEAVKNYKVKLTLV